MTVSAWRGAECCIRLVAIGRAIAEQPPGLVGHRNLVDSTGGVMRQVVRRFRQLPETSTRSPRARR